MNITKIQLVTNDAVDAPDAVHAEFKISGVSQNDRYILRGSTGLGVEDVFSKDAGYFVSPFPFGIGTTSNFNDMMLKDRIVSLSIKLNPDYAGEQTVGDLRDILYKTISYSRNKNLDLVFFFKTADGSGTCLLRGEIKKIEGELFSNDPTVTLIFGCSDPFFRSASSVSLDDPGYWGGEGDIAVITDDLSTAPHGFYMEFFFNDPADHLHIHNNDNQGFIIDHAFPEYSLLRFSSEYKNRDLYIAGDPNTHLMDKIRLGSVWPMMIPGETTITMHEPFGTSPGVIQLIEYKTAYWGV